MDRTHAGMIWSQEEEGRWLKLLPAYCLAKKTKSETSAEHLNTFKTNPLERTKWTNKIHQNWGFPGKKESILNLSYLWGQNICQHLHRQLKATGEKCRIGWKKKINPVVLENWPLFGKWVRLDHIKYCWPWWHSKEAGWDNPWSMALDSDQKDVSGASDTW